MYSIVGHTVAGDDLVTLATIMFVCSTSALVVVVSDDDGGKNKAKLCILEYLLHHIE